jgi:hypothetical protein
LRHVLGKQGDRATALGFVLNAIHAVQRGRPGSYCVEANGRHRFAAVREGDLDAIGVAPEGDREVRMLGSEMFEGFLTRCDNSSLQLGRGATFKAGRISKITRDATRRRRESRIGIDLYAYAVWISHCYSRGPCRKLHGSRGNSRDHLRTAGLCAALCRWCSTFRRRTDVPVCRKSRREWDRAWRPP